MVVAGFTTEEAFAIEHLREKSRHLLKPSYDTDYNLLRWAQGYDFNLDDALYHLIRHLKFRELYELEQSDKWKDDRTLKQYFPLGLVGATGKANYLLVVECAGRIDLQGILNSVQMSTFLFQRLKFQEMMLKEINKMEKIHNSQCHGVYILDLEGIKLDPKLLSIATGPYRILWTLVYTNYPEWLKTFMIINAPSFIALVWKAVAAFLPERTRNKVKIFSSQDEVREELAQYCDMSCVPKHWGGQLVDKNGDPMCRDRLVIPTDPIPKHLYWSPDKESPARSELEELVIRPGQTRIITVILAKHSQNSFMVINRFADRTYSMGLYYSPDLETGSNIELKNMEDYGPEFDYPAMPTTDYFKSKTLGAGVYKIQFGNNSAWFRSLTLYYRVRMVDENNVTIKCDITVD
ncbi:hypothetical protein AB6A40_003499 [Gnathostoma spinigerum]|uniref:CRAL-TRIO domain-containing protein n=1 Tax=Gnathostoma spinigerum TaxID=75299 RepID=A0ABD6E9R2_9BILA